MEQWQFSTTKGISNFDAIFAEPPPEGAHTTGTTAWKTDVTRTLATISKELATPRKTIDLIPEVGRYSPD